MTWLNAALAFALSMIVFSTIVSALTEVLHRVFHMREAGLKRMLDQIYERYVLPKLGAEVSALTKGSMAELEKIRDDFGDVLRRNLAVQGYDEVFPLRAWSAPRYLDSLSKEEFLQRLPDTKIGQLLLQRPRAELDALVNELGSRFERLGADATLYFRHRAGFVSLVFAFVVAFGLNVDAVRLFSSFITDEQLTSHLVARAEAIEKGYKAQAEKTNEAQAAEADPEILQASLGRLDAALDDSTVLGLPIGAAYFPWCWERETKANPLRARDPLCDAWKKAKDAGSILEVASSMSGAFATWLATTLLAGVLIGLGGPFWFDAARRLSQAIDVLRTSDFVRHGEPAAAASEKADASAADGAASASKAGGATPGVSTKTAPAPASIFNAAAGASSTASQVRPLRGRDGLPL